MKISNTVYFNTPSEDRTSASLALTPSALHTVEYLNVPTAGYSQPRFEKAHLHFTHPTLGLEFKMDIEEYIKITLKTPWNQALLVVGDDGKLYEYNPETLTVLVRVPVETFEHRRIVRNDEEVSDSEIFWVQSLDHKKMRASVLYMKKGLVSKISMSFNTLISDWRTVGTVVSNQLAELLKTAAKKPITDDTKWGSNVLTASLTEEGLVFENPSYTWPVMRELIADAEAQHKPLKIVNEYLTTSIQDWPSQQATFYFAISDKLIMDTQLLAKYWYSLPIKGFSAWEKTIKEQQEVLKALPENNGFYIDLPSSRLTLLQHNMSLFIYELNSLLRVIISSTPKVDENGQFFLKRQYKIQLTESLTEENQLKLLEVMRSKMSPAETIVRSEYLHNMYALPQLIIESQVPCVPTFAALEANLVEMLHAMQGYAAFTFEHGCLTVRQKGQILYDYEDQFPIVVLKQCGLSDYRLEEVAKTLS
jgi:hypothetical protein